MRTPDAGWRLRPAADADLPVLMSWFDGEDAVRRWGGPAFRYPFTAETFRKDALWPTLARYALCDPAGRFAAFGQLYDHLGRIHLARLVVEPGGRGNGTGRRLVGALLDAGRLRWPYTEASLYVFRDNTAALSCYLAAGFRIADFPPERAAFAESCYFLTREITGRRSAGIP